MLSMNKEQRDSHHFIKKCEESILMDVDYKKRDRVIPLVLTNTQRVINNNLIPHIIDQQMNDCDEDAKERMRYALTLEVNQNIEEYAHFYLPIPKLKFDAFERLSIPAIIGAILFGLFFYYTIGSLFKEEIFAAIIGMPIGAAFFVWLFSKVIKHPKITKLIKWSAVSGLVFITIGAVFSKLKKQFIFKPGLSFIQWIWLAILTLLTFWMLHLFKPRLEENVEEIECCLKNQLNILLYTVYDFICFSIKTLSEQKSIKTNIGDSIPPTKNFFEESKMLSASVQQMTYALETQDKDAALLSVNSFLNSLYSLGLHQLEKEQIFKFKHEDVKNYDTFGIIHEGDLVEQLFSAWVDDQGRCVFKGKVKKVKR